jgi:hypothetical protein
VPHHCWHQPGRMNLFARAAFRSCKHCGLSIEQCPCVSWGRSPNDACPACEGSGWVALMQSKGQAMRNLLEGDDVAVPITITFRAEDHSYTLNGQEAQSVTTALEAEGFSGCLFWDEKDRHRGTAVHKVAHLLGGTPWEGRTPTEIIRNSRWDPAKTHPAIVPFGQALAKFYLESGFMPELTEQPVGSLLFWVVGTFDQWGKMPNGRRVLVDYKSGKPQEAAHVQVALYDMCAKETLGLETDERMVVWLKPDGTYQVVLPKLEPNAYLNAGQSAVNCYKWRRRFKMIA